MPKINVYLSDDLAAAVREAGISVSPVCQQALAEAVRAVRASREASSAIRAPGFDPQQQPDIGRHVNHHMTPRLRRVIRRAHELVEPPGAVATEDLLVAVLDEPGNLGVLVLQSLGVDLAALRDDARRVADDAREDTPRAVGAAEQRGRSPRRRTGRRRVNGPRWQKNCSSASPSPPVLSWRRPSTWPPSSVTNSSVASTWSPRSATTKKARPVRSCAERGVTSSAVGEAIPAALAGAKLGFGQSGGTGESRLTDRLEQVIHRLDQFDERLRAGGL